jgi:hypothetical protein
MARNRASMREGPLADLFRATEAAQRQAKEQEAAERSSSSSCLSSRPPRKPSRTAGQRRADPRSCTRAGART